MIARTGLVLLECPTTGLQFNAGIRTDAEGLAALVDRGMQTTCPHCAEKHGLAHAMLDIDLTETPRLPGLPLRTHQTLLSQPTEGSGRRQHRAQLEDVSERYTGL